MTEQNPPAERGYKTLGIKQATILTVIRDNPSQAYGKAISKLTKTQHRVKIPTSQIYVYLNRLKKQGYIETTTLPGPVKLEDTARVFYKLTDAGLKILKKTLIQDISPNLTSLLQEIHEHNLRASQFLNEAFGEHEEIAARAEHAKSCWMPSTRSRKP